MRSVEETFFQLVRLGIGCSECRISSEIGWNKIKALADQQGLSAFVFDAINTSDVSIINSMPIQIKLEWIGEVLHNYEAKYVEYKKAICSLAGFYNQYGYKMMVLKGYACSLDWPRPEHRPCGDIDIWLLGEHKEADSLLASKNGIKIDNTHHHHTMFEWQGFMVENHYDFFNVYAHKSSREMEKIFKQLGHDDSYSVKVNEVPNELETNVYLPSPNLHALFLIRHLVAHFTHTCITLRQVLDWAFFVEKHTEEVDWGWLIGVMKKFHMIEFYGIISAICVEDLGFETSIFPTIQFRTDLKEKVLNDILHPKFSASEPSCLISRLIYKYRRWQGNAWKQELCFDESRWTAFWSGVWGHLLKPASI